MDAQGIAQPAATDLAREFDNVFSTALDLHRSGHLQQAEQLYRTLLSVNPGHSDALHMLGLIASASGKHDQAVALINEAIALNAHEAAYFFNRGVAEQSLGRLDDAAASYRRAVALNPDMREAHENLGVALAESGDRAGARSAYEAACALDPEAPIANANLGTLLLESGDHHDALEHIDRALDANPLNYHVRCKRASIYLWQGRYDEGWRDYEMRFCSDSFCKVSPPVNAPWPKWDGMLMPEGTLLVTQEQGLGDDILFASCMDELCELVRHVVIATDRRLVPLYRRSMRHATVVPKDESVQRFAIDRHVSAGSLPALLRPSVDYFPRRRQYLWADPDRVSHWRAWLGNADTLNIGVSWRGGSSAHARRTRSIPLAQWAPLLDAPGARMFDIQYGDHAAERDECNAGEIRLHSVDGLDCRDDIDELAAFISALDLVITIDNATAHLAAALGIDTWLLRPDMVEWRWREDEHGNPWLPAVTVFNPPHPGDWAPVMRRCAERLALLKTRPDDRVAALMPRVAERPVPQRERDASTVALLNDTTHWYHFGCTATSLAIHNQLRRKGHDVASVPLSAITGITTLPDSLEAFDDDRLYKRFATCHPDIVEALADASAVYVNGEGTLHRLGQQPLALLYLMRMASTRLGKPVHVINHSCYPEGSSAAAPDLATRIYRHVYAQLDTIAVREPTSAALLRDLGLEVVDSFDCLPLYVDEQLTREPDSDEPYIVITGGVVWRKDTLPALAALARQARGDGLQVRVLCGANAYPAGDEIRFVGDLLRAVDLPLDIRVAQSESDWLNQIANARLVVSSRFHHSIAAAFLDTPFLVSQSNTPKIGGLLERLSLDALLPLPVAGDAADARRYRDALLARARECLTRPDQHCLTPEVRAANVALSRCNF